MLCRFLEYLHEMSVHRLYCRCITDPAYEDVNNAFERALVFLHKVNYTCALHSTHTILFLYNTHTILFLYNTHHRTIYLRQFKVNCAVS